MSMSMSMRGCRYQRMSELWSRRQKEVLHTRELKKKSFRSSVRVVCGRKTRTDVHAREPKKKSSTALYVSCVACMAERQEQVLHARELKKSFTAQYLSCVAERQDRCSCKRLQQELSSPIPYATFVWCTSVKSAL